ncbi:FtsP/CotA-like multicopper oxidase with cupredoxin domain [Kribbella antiqua]|uniref:FtsP/CotA-like multicopper oxidase with cupredoxin domain n=1 Tax=Kribbella antiqua TaxID=2512217 RepID=A0A4R2IPK2_9ACTN|nr:multicopper oxidase family protein [Kribbella antiqua]TCO47113.1 FtsP/CotA-like multicopper oxidase with cupredoxin domain [Kribbella antiqua]
MSDRRRGRLIALGVTLAVLAPLGYLWATSLVPGSYSAAEMGYADYGGGPASSGHEHHGGRMSVADLTGPATGTPDVAVTLVARKGKYQLASGETVDGFTLNGTSPGPMIRAKVGDLVQVTLVNESVPDGATLHWHGIDVPNAEDGVAGVTQDAVRPGGKHVYRFKAEQAGTYWYHSHQVSSSEVKGGLFGPIVIGREQPGEVVAAIHTYDGKRTINGRTGTQRVELAAGTTARVRVINTDNAILRVGLVGTPYKVVAVDGRDLHGPTPVTAAFPLAAGARVDLEAVVPAGGMRLVAGSAAVSLGIGPVDPPRAELPSETVDLLSYGTPAALGFDPSKADRRFEYRIGRRPGFLDGVPGLWWTINGHKFPDVPMYMVAEGDIVRMTISNTSGQAHPMHLHGHHAVVLSRNGVASTGSPWWIDTLEVGNDETYEIAFAADNPGLWMDHCHNLPHASEGLMTHLMYEGTTTPYRIGGPTSNEPE